MKPWNIPPEGEYASRKNRCGQGEPCHRNRGAGPQWRVSQIGGRPGLGWVVAGARELTRDRKKSAIVFSMGSLGTRPETVVAALVSASPQTGATVRHVSTENHL